MRWLYGLDLGNGLGDTGISSGIKCDTLTSTIIASLNHKLRPRARTITMSVTIWSIEAESLNSVFHQNEKYYDHIKLPFLN